jgi:hypothetical protein
VRIQIPLAIAAALCTATASITMRKAAAPAPGEWRFSWRLVVFLLRSPTWFLGIACMIGGFGFQLAALHYGDLALVQPIIASELLFVFLYLAVRWRGTVRLLDVAAAAGMAASLGGFLFVASPSGGSTTGASARSWLLAGFAVAIAAVAAAGLSAVVGPWRRRRGAPTAARRAALLAVSAGFTWGFVSAVVKELAAQLGQGPHAVFTSWTPYVLLVTGAAGTFLASNAFQAGPLAASQPGLTTVEPLVAILLGITLFGEHVRHDVVALAVEAGLAAVVVGSVVVLSHSPMLAASSARGPGRRTGAPRGGGGRGPVDGPAADRQGAPRSAALRG